MVSTSFMRLLSSFQSRKIIPYSICKGKSTLVSQSTCQIDRQLLTEVDRNGRQKEKRPTRAPGEPAISSLAYIHLTTLDGRCQLPFHLVIVHISVAQAARLRAGSPRYRLVGNHQPFHTWEHKRFPVTVQPLSFRAVLPGTARQGRCARNLTREYRDASRRSARNDNLSSNVFPELVPQTVGDIFAD